MFYIEVASILLRSYDLILLTFVQIYNFCFVVHSLSTHCNLSVKQTQNRQSFMLFAVKDQQFSIEQRLIILEGLNRVRNRFISLHLCLPLGLHNKFSRCQHNYLFIPNNI